MPTQLQDFAHPLSGRWYLIGGDTPPGVIPHHHVEFVFRHDETGLKGAIQSRVDNQEFALRMVTFDGTELRLQMAQFPNAAQLDDPPFLVMRPVDDRFEGSWDMPGVEHIRLKLVRAAT